MLLHSAEYSVVVASSVEKLENRDLSDDTEIMIHIETIGKVQKDTKKSKHILV